jgi:hypothetical protein
VQLLSCEDLTLQIIMCTFKLKQQDSKGLKYLKGGNSAHYVALKAHPIARTYVFFIA